MKKVLSVFLSGLIILTNPPVSADVFDETDDRYFGIQMTIPLDTSRNSIFAGKAEYSAMFVDQRDGITDGVTYTLHANGAQTIGLLSPSTSFEIGRSKLSDYTIPVVNLTEGSAIHSNYGMENPFIMIAIGAVVIVKLVDVVADEIVNCIAKDDDDCNDEDDGEE